MQLIAKLRVKKEPTSQDRWAVTIGVRDKLFPLKPN
jgi:hypothetical protein